MMVSATNNIRKGRSQRSNSHEFSACAQPDRLKVIWSVTSRAKRGQQETAPHARGLLLITLVLYVFFQAQYSNHSLHTTFLFITMANIKKMIRRKLKDLRTNDADYVIPIQNPQEDDIIIPYVVFSGFRG